MPTYRYSGNRDKHDRTSKIVVTSNGTPVQVAKGQTVELTADELAKFDDRFFFVPSTDPVAVEPVFDPVYVRKGTNQMYSSDGAALSAESLDNARYIAVMFKDHLQDGFAENTAEEPAVYLAYSDDGLTFRHPGDEPLLFPKGDGFLQDPTLLYRPDSEWKWLLTGTWITYLGGSTQQRQMQVYRSRNLLEWQTAARIDTETTVAGTKFVWAPQFFLDDDGEVYIVAAIAPGTGTPGSPSRPFRPYIWRMTADDASTFAVGQKMTRSGTRVSGAVWDNVSMIDGAVVNRNGTYHLFAKEETNMRIAHFTASALTGPWVNVSENIGASASWMTSLEAPTIVQLDNGSYRMYLDHWTDGATYRAESADLVTWGATSTVTIPGRGRHLDVLRVRLPRKLMTDLDLVRAVTSRPTQGNWTPLINTAAALGGVNAAPPSGYPPHGAKRVGNTTHVRGAFVTTTAITTAQVVTGVPGGMKPLYGASGTATVFGVGEPFAVPILIIGTGGLWLGVDAAKPIPQGATVVITATYPVGDADEIQ